MADNTTLNVGASGDVIRDIDRAGVKTQVVQIDAGGSSAEALVSNAAGAGMPIRDTLVVANAASVTATGTIGSATDTTGYASFMVQVTGTFSATVQVQFSDDNVNWQASWYQTSTSFPANTTNFNLTGALTPSYGPVRGRYVRLQCTAFTSNTSSAFTLILRSALFVPDIINITASGSLSTVQQATNAQLGSTAFVKAAATTNATSIKASAGSIYGLCLTNNSAAVKYIKFYNKASAPVVGTDTPVCVFALAANGGNLPTDHVSAIPRFTTGIAYAITGAVADSDTTAVAVNDVSGWLLYA